MSAARPCRNGTKCWKPDCHFKHPEGWNPGGAERPCRNGTKCWKPDCHFKHPEGWNPRGTGDKKASAGHAQEPSGICRKGINCWKPDCRFKHPEGWNPRGTEHRANVGRTGDQAMSAARPCRNDTKCWIPDCRFKHPEGWFPQASPCVNFAAGVCALGDKCEYQHVPTVVAPPWHDTSAQLGRLEKQILELPTYDLVRLPCATVTALLACAEAVYMQCGVEVSSLSPNGLRLRCPGGKNLCTARQVLSQLGGLADTFTVHRLVIDRCRLVFTSDQEADLSNTLWVGRRVLVLRSGQVLQICKLQVQNNLGQRRILLTLRDADGETEDESVEEASETGSKAQESVASFAGESELSEASSEEEAGAVVDTIEAFGDDVVCWDNYGSADSVSVLHRNLQDDALTVAFLRGVFSSVGTVENVRPGQSSKQYCNSIVTFDICRDPLAPARAVSQLHGRSAGGSELRILVEHPGVPVRLTSNLPSIISIKGAHTEQDVRRKFGQQLQPTIASVKQRARGRNHVGAKNTNRSADNQGQQLEAELQEQTLVKFSSSDAAAAALKALPVGTARLHFGHHFRGNVVICRDVPVMLPPKELWQFVTAAATEGNLAVNPNPWKHMVVRRLGAATKTVKFFPKGIQAATAIIAAAPVLLAPPSVEGSDFQNCLATASALLGLLSTEEALDRVQASREAEAEQSETDGSELSAPSDPPISRVSAQERLWKLRRTDLQKDVDVVLQVRQLRMQLNDIITEMWPRRTIKGRCWRFVSHEVGLTGSGCAKGFACHRLHKLEECRFADCQRNCGRLHREDFQTILRLDVQLASILSKERKTPDQQQEGALRWVDLLNALDRHRSCMNKEAERLIARHKSRLAYCQDARAVESQVQELARQLAEFERAFATFLESATTSFVAARIFAREVYNRFKTCLPIYAERQTILESLKEDWSVLVLSAETGSGKSTQVVQYLSENVHGRILCTQPRRVAAATLADRVAEEMQTEAPSDKHPNLVACRGGDKQGDNIRTGVQFLTDASLLNMLFNNPTLRGVAAVVVDEVHERSLNTDILIALLRRTLLLRAQEAKMPFKLVLTSATMNESLFAKYFSRKNWDTTSPLDSTWAPVLKVGGRTFPVSVHYENGSQKNYQWAAEVIALRLNDELPATDVQAGESHDILIFLTQADEVERLAKSLAQKLPSCLCLPLHGSLDREEQRKAFELIDPRKHIRKIVVATNIAETSVTINGIGAVIDSGLAKQAMYDSGKDATVLRTGFISQSSAKQRAGRAGRTAPGKCYRLYSKEEFEDFPEDTPAELLRVDPTGAILCVLRHIQKQREWIPDVRQFPFVEHPGKDRLSRSLTLLFHLGAINDDNTLTLQGSRMARMSTPPRHASILFAASRFHVLEVVAVALSMTSRDNLFRRGRNEEEKNENRVHRMDFGNEFPDLGDVGVAIAVWLVAKAVPNQKDLRKWAGDHGINFYALKDAMKETRRMAREITTQSMSTSAIPSQSAKHAGDGKASGERVKEVKQVVDARKKDGARLKLEERPKGVDIDAILVSLTAESFKKEETRKLLLKSFLAGFFSSIAFYLPPRAGDNATGQIRYFIPASNSLGMMGSSTVFRLSEKYPSVCIYMEMMENRNLYISSLFAVDEGVLHEILPPSFRGSEEYKRFRELNERLQMLARPEVVATDSFLALKQYAGYGQNNPKLAQLGQHFRQSLGIPGNVELVLDVDMDAKYLLVMCPNDEKRKAVAALAEKELSACKARLDRHVREWAVPGTSVRAIVGAGGECKELLVRGTQTICVRFSTHGLSKRLSEPITIARGIPQGWFDGLVNEDPQKALNGIPPEHVLSYLRTFSGNYEALASQKQQAIADLKEACTKQEVLSAIAYTAGPVCYHVNPLLRNFNEEECRKAEPYIRGLLAFHAHRANHPANRRGLRVVYRGTSLSRETSFVPGEVIVWPAFTSTTTDLGVARSFTGSGGGDTVCYIFEITTPFWCPLEDISVFPAEREILLPAFSHLQVLTVTERDNVREVKLQHVPWPSQELAHGKANSDMRAATTGRGPIRIDVKSSRPEDIAEELERQLCQGGDDPDVEIKIYVDREAVRGRAWFSNTVSAAKACALLHGSIIGNQELSVRPSPEVTDSLPLRFCVRATLSMMDEGHSGYANVKCGSSEQALQLLDLTSETFKIQCKAQRPKPVIPGLSPGKPKKYWRKLALGKHKLGVGLCVLDPDKGPEASWVSISRVPKEWRQKDLQMALSAAFPTLPANCVQPLHRTNDWAQERKRLQQTGVKGTRDRVIFLASLAGASLDYIEEVSLERGALSLLWFTTYREAKTAADVLQDQRMPATGLVVNAEVDCSCHVLFPGKSWWVVEPLVQAVKDDFEKLGLHVNVDDGSRRGKRLDIIKHDQTEENVEKGNKRVKRPAPDVKIAVRGPNMEGVADAYSKLMGLKSGKIIKVTAANRPKIFPPKNQVNQIKRVENFVTRLQEKHQVVIDLLWASSSVRVTGSEKGQPAVEIALAEFLMSSPFELQLRIPPRHSKEIERRVRELVKSKGSSVEVKESKQLRLCTLSAKETRDVRECVADALEELPGARVKPCLICMQHCTTVLDTCGHRLCDDCGEQHITTQIAENRIPVCCPKNDCKRLLLQQDLAKLMGRVDPVFQAGVRLAVLQSPQLFVSCATPGCSQILDRKAADVTCSLCLRNQCPACGSSPHVGRSCEEHKKGLMFARSEEGQAAAHSKVIVEEMLVPSCPGCKVNFIDFDGCFAVTCITCHTHFCGWCLHNCEKTDAHPHVATCQFYQRHFSSAGCNGTWGSPEQFRASMRIRLPELVADYFQKEIPSPALRRLLMTHLSEHSALSEATFFDLERLKQEMQARNAC
eukprot:g69157.t1